MKIYEYFINFFQFCHVTHWIVKQSATKLLALKDNRMIVCIGEEFYLPE